MHGTKLHTKELEGYSRIRCGDVSRGSVIVTMLVASPSLWLDVGAW